MSNKRRLLPLLPWIIAPLLLVWVLRAVPLDEAWAILQQISLPELLGLALLNVLVLLSFSGRWWIILRSQGHRIPYLRLVGYRLAAFGVTYFTPGPQFGGEPVQVYLPEKRDGVPRSTAVAAVTLDKTLELLANFAFLAGGVALMVQRRLLSDDAERVALAAALILFVLPPLFLLAIWAGGRPMTRTARAVVWPAQAWKRWRPGPDRAVAGPDRITRLLGGVESSERQVRAFCRQHPAALAAAMAVTLLSWLGMIAEYWLALWALGIPLSPAQVIVALTAARIAFLIALPAGLGALEASQVLVFGAMGINPAAGLSLSLLIRLRDTALAALGVWWGLRLARPAHGLPSLPTYATVPAHRATTGGNTPALSRLRRNFSAYFSWTRRQLMITKTQWALVALVVITALVLSACQPVLAPPQSGSTSDATPTAEPVVITLAYNRFLQTSFGPGPAPIDVIRAEVAKQYPNIDVRLNLMPDTINGMREALAVWIASEDPTVDIYGMDMPWVQEFGRAGWAVPLDELASQLEENYIANGLDVFSYEGQRLGVPFWSSVSGTFYRTDLLEAAGFAPPQTYDELVEIAQAITAQDPELSGFVWAGVKDEQLVMTWSEFLLGFGGRYFDDAGQCAMNSPEGVEALSFMVNLIESGVSPREVPAWKAEEARTRFAEGKAVFLRHNHDIVVWLDDPERSAVAGKWAVMPNPAQPGGQTAGVAGGFAFAVNPYSDNKTEALQVMEIIAGLPAQKGFAIAWGPVQYYNGLYDDPEVAAANPNADTIGPLLTSAVPRPPSVRYTELSSILQDEIHSAITGIKPAEQALNDACQRIDGLEQ
ncbi:MAG TPA: extracellular solute-binding protein [Anaerolineae bacterium]|nr:extracellular solute-binding protein [Anaerolineae bacterium]